MLLTIVSIISSMILKLNMGFVIFLDIICLHRFIRGYPFFYFYCAGMWKHNHWKQKNQCVKQTIKYIEQGGLSHGLQRGDYQK